MIRELKNPPASKLYFWLLALVEITLFFPIKINTYAITILAVFWFFYSILTPGKIVVNTEYWIFFFFFLMFVIGMSYTSNIEEGLRQIEKRSAMVFLPLIIFSSKISLSRKDISNLLLIFCYTGLFIALVLLIVASVRYSRELDVEVFYYKRFTEVFRLHPVYYSYYLLFGLVARFIVCYRLKYKSTFFWLTNLFGLFILFLLASKMVLIVLFVIAVLLFVFFFTSIRILYRIMMIGFFFGVLLSTIFLISGLRDRVLETFNSNLSDLFQDEYVYNHPFNGLSLRLVFWRLSIEHLQKDGLLLWGVGTGDATDYLNEIYSKHGLLDAGYANYNVHNEYVQTLLTIGIPGLLCLIFVYSWGIYRAVTQRDFFLFCLMLILVFSSWSESSLSVNKGIVFFSFFYSILLLRVQR